MGEPREETPAFIREALADAITPLAPYPSAAGLPELRAAIAGWAARRFGVTLDPDTEVIPTLGSKEAVFGARQRLRRRGRGRADARLPGLRARRGVRGQARARAAAARGERLAAGPRRRRLDRRRDPLAQLPEQPDGRAGAGRVLRGRRRPGARARVRARLRRGLLGALLRGRAAGSRAAGARPLARRGLQHALQALVDARLPLGLRRRRPGDRRRAEEVPARTSASRRWTSSSAPRSPPGATRTTSTRCASATAPSATRCCPRWRRSGCATRAATRRSSCGSTPARTPTRSPPLARGGRGRRARLVLRRARATCGSRSSRRPRTARAPPSSSAALP